MSISSILKEARQELGLSIDEVSNTLRINKKYIRAMEDGNFLILPSLVYAKGFLKAYCELLKLDPRPMMDELIQNFKPKEAPKRIQPVAKEEPKESIPINYKNIAIAVAAVSAVLLILFGIFSYFSSPENYSSAPATEAAEKTVTPPVKPVQIAKKPSIIKSVQAAKPAADQRPGVKVEAVSPAWISVATNGERVYSGTLEAGHWIMFRGKEIKVATNNGGNVKVYLNGVDQGHLGASGSNAEKVFHTEQ